MGAPAALIYGIANARAECARDFDFRGSTGCLVGRLARLRRPA